MSHGRILPRLGVIVTVALAACDAPTEASCEERACEHVAACSPVVTGGVDWRTPETCLGAWTCADEGACLAAVRALPCLSSPPTWDEIEANSRAMGAVRVACLGWSR